MSARQICSSLMKWLQTFEISVPHETIPHISDGVAVAQALSQIAPEYFNDEWMAKIKVDTGDNWRLRVSNLRKIVNQVLHFYQETVGHSFPDFSLPDVNKIGEHEDEAQTGRLLQLVLGCAVNCHRKQEYIERIMEMEESVQQVIMAAIQELMAKEGDSLEPEGHMRRILEDLEAATEAKEALAYKCQQLETQITLLQDEKAALGVEKQKLMDRLEEMEALEGAPGSSQRYKQLKVQIDRMQEEMFKLESGREEARMKAEVLEKELAEAQARQEELQELADEARTLKDEVDVLRETCGRVAQYEATIETYKKKLDELGDLKRQIRLLEEKNTDYMQQNMELEEEVKKSGSWRPQLDIYKKQVMELHQKLTDATNKADKSQFESKRTLEKLQALYREKERLTNERDTLKELNEELRLAQLQSGSHPPRSPPSAPLSPTDLTDLEIMEMMPPEVKERLLRLQHENKQLRSRVGGLEEGEQAVLRAMMDDLKTRESQLQSENRLANQRVLELESQLEERGNSGAENWKRRLEELERENQNKTMQIGEMEIRQAEQVQRIEDLQESLSRKDSEIMAMEARYKKYLDKAKSVIQALDPKQSPAANLDVTLLKHQIVEKDKLIDSLEKEHDKTKAVREVEERLMTTAFYNLGLQLQRHSVEQRLSNISGSQSFLARQRQAARRPGGGNLGNSEFYDF